MVVVRDVCPLISKAIGVQSFWPLNVADSGTFLPRLAKLKSTVTLTPASSETIS
jgi:hypothetical protein